MKAKQSREVVFTTRAISLSPYSIPLLIRIVSRQNFIMLSFTIVLSLVPTQPHPLLDPECRKLRTLGRPLEIQNISVIYTLQLFIILFYRFISWFQVGAAPPAAWLPSKLREIWNWKSSSGSWASNFWHPGPLPSWWWWVIYNIMMFTGGDDHYRRRHY